VVFAFFTNPANISQVSYALNIIFEEGRNVLGIISKVVDLISIIFTSVENRIKEEILSSNYHYLSIGVLE